MLSRFLTLLCLSLVACAQTDRSRPDDVAADSAAIIIGFKALVAAFEAAPTPDSAAALYVGGHTEDAVLMFPGQRPVAGHSAIRPLIAQIAADYRFSFPRLDTRELRVAGDWAFHRFDADAVIVPRKGGAEVRESRKYVDIWRRGADGRRRIARHIFNSDR